MRSRPPKQIEQQIDIEDNDDVVVATKDDGPAISSTKKNTLIIVIASIVLVIICYFVFIKDIKTEKKVIEPVVNVEELSQDNVVAEEIAPKQNDQSIFDLEEIDKREKTENVNLLEKRLKPEVPDLPELPKEDISNDPLNLAIEKGNQEKENKEGEVDKSGKSLVDVIIKEPSVELLDKEKLEEFKLKDQKIKELEAKIKEQEEFSTKEKQALIDDYNKKEQERKKLEQQKAITDKQKEEESSQSVFEPRYSPIVVFSDRRDPAPANGVGQDRNIISLNEKGMDEIKKLESSVDVSLIKDRVRTIAQGKLLTAILETSINTEFPGLVRGIITRDVYGEAGKDVLIPRGSRLYGNYSSEIRRGQGRVNISWTRLLLPNGVSLNISLSAADQFGRAGIAGEVDNRYSSLVANSLLTSVLAVAGTAAAQKLIGDNSQTSTTLNAVQGTTTTFGNASNQALYDVSKSIIDIVGNIVQNTIDLNPLIRIPQGTRMTVIVNADIIVPKIK